MDEAYLKDSSFAFVGTPTDIDVEQELEKNAGGLAYDPYRLAEVMVKIGQQMMGVLLYSYQEKPAFRIIYSILARDGAEITMLYARQSGKSETSTFCIVTLGVLLPVLSKIFPQELGHFSRGVKMGLLAPQGEQVATIYARCMERLHSEPVRMFLDDPDILDAPLSTASFKLKSGSTLTGQSAAKQSKIESKTYHIIFLDEAQDIDTEKVRKSIIPMTASTFGTVVRTGTPSRQKGDFYYTIKNNEKTDAKLKTPKEKDKKQLHFQYDYLEVIKSKKEMFKTDKQDFHLLYEKSVMRDKKSWGEGSDIFRLAYKVEWILEVGMFITEKDLEEKCYDKRMNLPTIDVTTDFVVAGLDIASARNSTVLTTGIIEAPAMEFGDHPKKTIVDWLVLSGVNYEEQFQVLAEELIQKRVQVLFADYTGVGRALTDVLMYHLSEYMLIVPYNFSPGSKSDMWKSLDEDITNRRLVVPANKMVQSKKEFKDFVEQMTNMQKYWRGSFMVCEKTQGFEDDYCDSLALMNLAGNHLYSPPMDMEVQDNIMVGNAHRNSMKQRSRW